MKELIVLLGISTSFILWVFVSPAERDILVDVSISHPFIENERVPFWLTSLASFPLPLAIILLISYFYNKTKPTDEEEGSSVGVSEGGDLEGGNDCVYNETENNETENTEIANTHKINVLRCFLGLLLAIILSIHVTQFLKMMIGRARPDFMSRCLGTEVADPKLLPLRPNGSIDIHKCPNADKELIRDGYRSFPSGHASGSFAGLGFLSIWLAGLLGVFDGDGKVWRVLVSLLPLNLAAYISLTRLLDYRHHWDDLAIGAIIGVLSALVGHLVYCGRPKMFSANNNTNNK